jgi:hypothetical protein
MVIVSSGRPRRAAATQDWKNYYKIVQTNSYRGRIDRNPRDRGREHRIPLLNA